ncbi:MAG: radical SAM-associated putative lipoprotein [Paludibacteraceae bacterium]|nr:radical SAM-associated putative lipoprotein [Paludibacteraceae bacterium]MBR4713053.1 radical SAM-associated putative lipoprotein [Paludibacteraceae bacterium]
MKWKFFKLLSGVFLFVWMLCGFVSCVHSYWWDDGHVWAKYTFEGQVTDAEGHALSGVKVSFLYNYKDVHEEFFCVDSLTTTDEEGKYLAIVVDESYWPDKHGLRFTDKEGAILDTFFKATNLASLRGGDGEWYKGHSDNILNIKWKK